MKMWKRIALLLPVVAWIGCGGVPPQEEAQEGDMPLSQGLQFANGLLGEYFDNADFTGTRSTRVDATVNFSWAQAAPVTGLGADTFSVRWTGKVVPRYSETYTFSTVSDDGVRLWVDGKLLIDNWTNHSAATNSGTVALLAGRAYDLRLEYYDNTGSATIQLSWASASQAREIIPSGQLFPTADDQANADRIQRTALLIDVGSTTPTVDRLGRTWEADRDYLGLPGDRVDRGAVAVAGTEDDRIYQTERYWLNGYSLPLANGTYDVVLHFAEFNSTAAGDRVLGIRVEDQKRSGVDVFAAVGAARAYPVTFEKVSVVDGRLDIGFTYYTRNVPMLHGIEVLRSLPAVAPTCSDGVMNGAETGVDCGGSCAAACPVVDVEALVENAVAAGATSVRIPPGVHRVNAAINIRDGKGIVVDGTGATLVFTHRGTAFYVQGSGATLRGMTIDFDPLTFTQGKVETVDTTNRVVTMRLDDGYPDATFITGPISAFLFDKTTERWKRDWVSVEQVVSSSTSRVVTLTGVNGQWVKDFTPGDFVVLAPRTSNPAIQFIRGTGEARLEQVTLYGSSGVALYGQHWSGRPVFDQFTLTRGPTPKGATHRRLISTNMDALNWVLCRQAPEVYGADVGYQGDDGANFHGAVFDVVRSETGNVLVLKPTPAWADLAYIARPGEVARVMAQSNWAPKNELPLTQVQKFSENNVTLFRVSFSAAPGAQPGDVVDFPALNCPGMRVRGGFFHDNRARGMLLKGNDVRIEGARIEGTTGAGVLLSPEYINPNYRESGWVDGVHLERTLIRGTELGLRSMGTTFPGHTRLEITNNLFSNISGNGIQVGAASGVSITNNQLSNIGQTPIVVGSEVLNAVQTGNTVQ
jgi:hypothetical protein